MVSRYNRTMKFFLTLLYFSLLIFSSMGIGPGDDSPMLQKRRDMDFFGHTRQLIVDLAGNLRKSAHEAGEAVGNFSTGIEDEIKLFTEKMKTDLNKFEERITDAVNTANGKLNSAGELVTNCIESHRQEAEALVHDTFAKSKACADNRIKELDEMINYLNVISAEVDEYAATALDDMRSCVGDGSGNFFTVGSCLGTIVLQTQTKGAIFMANSGLLIARINFAMATLPAAFDICAGTNIMAASIGTGKIIVEIGSCTASSVFTYLINQ